MIIVLVVMVLLVYYTDLLFGVMFNKGQVFHWKMCIPFMKWFVDGKDFFYGLGGKKW